MRGIDKEEMLGDFEIIEVKSVHNPFERFERIIFPSNIKFDTTLLAVVGGLRRSLDPRAICFPLRWTELVDGKKTEASIFHFSTEPKGVAGVRNRATRRREKGSYTHFYYWTFLLFTLDGKLKWKSIFLPFNRDQRSSFPRLQM